MADNETAENAADSTANFLTKKIGPLPVWAWGATVLAGLALSYYLSTRSNGASSGTKTDSAQPRVVETVSGYPGVGRMASGWNYNPPPPEQEDKEGFANNQEWGRYVIDHMIAQGYDPEIVDKAVRTYLSNLELTDSEQVIINIILSKYGTPPSLIGPPENPPDSDKPIGQEEPSEPSSPSYKPRNPYRPNPNAPGKYDPPTNVEAKALSPFKVRITFDEPDPKAQSYRVYSNYSNTNIGVTLDNYIVINGLYPDTDYAFWVVSVDRKNGWGGERGNPSAPAYVHTPSTSVGGPTLGGNVTVPIANGYKTITVTPWADSLGEISARYLGSAHRWPEIYNLNRDKLNNPNMVAQGMTLRIPE